MSKENSCIIFNLVHGSFVDGPGIRTTVFLKGCPLRCQWCCNPEGQRFEEELCLTDSRCNGCMGCVSVCPQNALSVQEGKILLDRNICDGCGCCAEACTTGAIEIFGKRQTAEEVFQELIKDEAFYRDSGGGVTIGGGEATCHPQFVRELMKLCHDRGISVAIDTCGYTVSDEGFAVLMEADLLLYDIKGIHSKRHLENTGVDNERILENLCRLDEAGKRFIVRIPVIPGCNADRESLEEMASFLAERKHLVRVDLIFYHEYGKVKYEQLGRLYPMTAEPFSKDECNAIGRVFSEKGLPVQFGG